MVDETNVVGTEGNILGILVTRGRNAVWVECTALLEGTSCKIDL